MLTHHTVEKLREMRLGAMASAVETQLADPQYHELSFECQGRLRIDPPGPVWN